MMFMQVELFLCGERVDLIWQLHQLMPLCPKHYFWFVKVVSYFHLPCALVNCFLIYLMLHSPCTDQYW